MLRARPIHFTSRLDQWERLLTGLGLVKTVDEPTWREFDAGSGRLALHFVEAGAPEEGTTSFGVEVGDLDEFARRTGEAGEAEGGTKAELIEANHGRSCRVSAPDGFTFLADSATRAADGTWGGAPDADPGIAVVQVWFAGDALTAAQTLRNIGAHPRPVRGTGDAAGAAADANTAESEAFTAKNGGVLMVGAGTGAGQAGFGFEYAGDITALRGRLAAAGHDASVISEAVPVLHVVNPDAGGATAHPPVWISAAPPAG